MSEVSRRAFLTISAASSLLAATGQSTAMHSVPSPFEAPAIDALRDLIDAARYQTPNLVELMRRHLPGLSRGGAEAVLRDKIPTEAGDMKWGTVASNDTAAVWGRDFLFTLLSELPATISIDEQLPVPMTRVVGTHYWFRLEALRLGETHNFTLFSDGQNVGTGSVTGYGPESYPVSGVPHGTLSEKQTVTSSLYGGAEASYWLYINPGIDEVRGAPLMIWLDGSMFVGQSDVLNVRMQTVTDYLVHRKLIPPMVHLLLSPGDGGEPLQPQYEGQTQFWAMRSLQFDTVSDLFNRYLDEEVLPQIEKNVKLRHDGYSRGICGQSSGGVCAFKVAWFEPEKYSRVYSSIGSFTGLQWHPERQLDGGDIFPLLVRREPRRNVRVWLSDGLNDLDVDYTGRKDIYLAGSWPLGNLAMAQALKANLYDFHFRFGKAHHNAAQWALDLPESLPWLWRDYDPEKTSEIYQQEAEEREKPFFRVEIANRSAW